MAQFSERIRRLQPSPIREILSLIDQSDMVSFAGGLPAQESFPEFDSSTMPPSYLQYGPTEGEPELRELISTEMASIGLHCEPGQVLILSGSQQGIDLCAKLFIDRGTTVALETPSYLAALQVFRLFGAEFIGLDPNCPDTLLDSGQVSVGSRPELVYAIPTFQNPSGHCYDMAQRERLAGVCDAGSFALFEDDPYRELSYEPCERTPICSLVKTSTWVYQGSFSKCLAPGLRLGFLVCSDDLIVPLTRLKQAADLHSSRISQWLVWQQLKDSERHTRIASLVDLYRHKRDIFAELLHKYFFDLASWNNPKGGLFFWLKLNVATDTNELLLRAIKRKVAFMPGEHFFYDAQARHSYLRLNFSHASQQQAELGLSTLAELLHESASENFDPKLKASASP